MCLYISCVFYACTHLCLDVCCACIQAMGRAGAVCGPRVITDTRHGRRPALLLLPFFSFVSLPASTYPIPTLTWPQILSICLRIHIAVIPHWLQPELFIGQLQELPGHATNKCNTCVEHKSTPKFSSVRAHPFFIGFLGFKLFLFLVFLSVGRNSI